MPRPARPLPARPAVLAAAALALLVSACAPNLGELPVIKPINAYFASKSLQAPPAEWPGESWWTSYNDPQLNSLIEKALASAPDMAIAQARINQARGQAMQAGASAFPSLEANGSVAQTRQSYNNGAPPGAVPQGWNDTGQYTLNFNYEIDFWGKNRAALAAATSQEEAARADAAQARLILTTSVVNAYAQFAQQVAERQEAISDTVVRGTTAALIANRQRNGLENMGSLNQAQAQKASAEADVAALDEQLAHTRNRIAVLVGEGPDFGLSLASPTVDISRSAGLPGNLAVNLIGRRPDIIAARLRTEAAAKRIKVAKAAYYPNINLSAYIGREALGLDLLNRSTSTIGSVGPAIHLPLFAGGRIEGGYRAARGEYDEAVATYNKAVAQALSDVADVAASQQALAIRQARINQAVKSSQAAYRIANNRYRGGLATFLEVLTAEDQLINNRRAATTLQAQAFLLDVSLVRALGGGLNDPSSSQPAVKE